MTYRTAPILFVATAVAFVLGIALLLPPFIEEFNQPYKYDEKQISSLLKVASRVALHEGQPKALQTYVNDMLTNPRVLKIVISDQSSKVVASSWKPDQSKSNGFALSAAPYSHWSSFDIMDGATQIGNISIQFADRNWRNSMQRLAALGVVVFGGGILLILLSGWTANSLMNQKISRLSKGIKEVTKGNFKARAQIGGRDEIGRLGRSFDGMVQELERSTRALRESEERFDLAARGTNDGIFDWNTESNTFYLSPRFKQILGYSEKELPSLYNVWIDLLHPDDRERVQAELKQHLEHQTLFESEFRMRTKAGQWRWVLGRGQAVQNKDGHSQRVVGSHTDITYRKQAERNLHREKERLLVTLQSIEDGVITADMNGRIEYLNTAAATLTGWSEKQSSGAPLSEVLVVIDERRDQPLPNLVKAIAKHRKTLNVHEHAVLISQGGDRFFIELSVSPLKDQSGTMIGIVVVFHNTTERRSLMRKLSHHATHDGLTHLINRYEFENRLNQALESARNDNARHVLCYLDLDQFKIVNDTSGHAAGDEMLRQIAKLLTQQFRAGDTLARLGGDEFGLLLERCPMDKAMALVEKARAAIKDYRFTTADRSFTVGVSIGVVEIRKDSGSTADILTAVDQACYIAKDKGRDRVQIYQPDDQDASRRSGDVEWAKKLQHALDEDRFVLFAQPIVALDPKQKNYRHYEILLRMKDPKGKIIAPGAFLPAAERYGMMGDVDRWVVRNTMESLATAWQGRSIIPINTVALNLSGGMLSDESFLDFIKDNLKEFKLRPSTLCFEITETVAIANFTQAQTFISELKQLGCRFSLDDFGSGFASFSYLKTLPVDYLKIDGSFVRHMDKDPIDHAMVDVINRIGQVMNLKTIAEFVENADIVRALETLKVDYAQGYHLGKPRPLYEVIYPEND